jgi:hypothetical protein
MNKINLSITSKNSTLGCSDDLSYGTDPMVVDEIIKNVDIIKNVVLEMKRKITYDHIRCIMKGKDITQKKSIELIPLVSGKKGLIEFSLK